MVSVSPVNITVNESSSFTVRCEATGHPLPLIDWIVDSKSVIEKDKYIIKEEEANAYTAISVLTVLDSLPNDAVEYKCRAQSNEFLLVGTSMVNVIGQFLSS